MRIAATRLWTVVVLASTTAATAHGATHDSTASHGHDAARPARVPADGDTVLRVIGSVGRPVALTMAEFRRLPHRALNAEGHDTRKSEFRGVDLYELLKRAEVPQGKDVRGPRIARVVMVESADGYRAAFAMAEADTSFSNRAVLVADLRDGKPDPEGPLRLVVPSDSRFGRWVRDVVRIRVLEP